MLDWLIIAYVKVLKCAILAAVALATPPEEPTPRRAPGLGTNGHATIIVTAEAFPARPRPA